MKDALWMITLHGTREKDGIQLLEWELLNSARCWNSSTSWRVRTDDDDDDEYGDVMD